MAGNNYNVTGDNLPKDSGNRYTMAWYDPTNNAFFLPYAYPVQASASAAGMAIGHMYTAIRDIITATGTNSSGVDLGGYTVRGLFNPGMGSAGSIQFQASATIAGIGGWYNITTSGGVAFSATAGPNYALGQEVLQHLVGFRYIRIVASQNQTANRTFQWEVQT